MRSVCLLGASGSIGRQTLDCIRSQAKNGDDIHLYAAAVGSDVLALRRIVAEFHPEYIGINDTAAEIDFFPSERIIRGNEACAILAALPQVDIVVNAVSGFSGVAPFLAAIKAGKTIAAANKESIVCAQMLERRDCGFIVPYDNGARIIPIDSEQSAIFQCLEDKSNIESVILTASGGAFRDKTAEELENVTVADALKHPTWSMGKKITIDSATLFNKGLEVMEAAYLFGMCAEQIEVVIHPQSIVHSAVRFRDGALKAQLGTPDMRTAIQYALYYPERRPCISKPLDLTASPLTFTAPDRVKYPALDLAYAALRDSKYLPIVYNGANEAAVSMFMEGRIKFTDIAKCVEYAMNHTPACDIDSYNDIMEVDRLARYYASQQ